MNWISVFVGNGLLNPLPHPDDPYLFLIDPAPSPGIYTCLAVPSFLCQMSVQHFLMFHVFVFGFTTLSDQIQLYFQSAVKMALANKVLYNFI